jgi:DNA-binding NarL/FixJ family response regulator
VSGHGAVRVVVVDDQALVRMGLRTLLGSEDGLELVGEAADGVAGLALVRETVPDVALLDIRMPRLDGLAVLREISEDEALTGVRVIVLTTFELDEYVFEALRHGASGFVLKDSDPAELLQAIRVVADGGSLLSPTVTRRVIDRFAGQSAVASAPHPELGRLTDREREIVGWVATGRSNDEIAAELVVSPDTVRTHVSRAMLKLHARDRAQLVVFAIQSGVTGPDADGTPH